MFTMSCFYQFLLYFGWIHVLFVFFNQRPFVCNIVDASESVRTKDRVVHVHVSRFGHDICVT